MLKIDHIFKTFNNVCILNDITVTIEKNQIIGLAGPSGGGKSTLLRSIQGLETIDKGTIQTHAKSGFMFQDFQLFPHMTVLQNLTYAPKIKKTSKDIDEKATALLETLGVDHKKDSYPNDLSGGQKQRVALARSLMMDPELLLCDEPTSGLDVATIEDVIDLLVSIKDMGVTMIIASHDLDFLTKISDRILLLKNGKVVFDDNPNILEEPIKTLKDFY